MKIINLIASPGSGKSTGAALLFAMAKLEGFSCELVTEYAKTKIYERSDEVLKNQVYLMAKQYKMVKDLEQYGVQNVFSDSPLLLGIYYGRHLPYFPEFRDLLLRLYGEFDNYNVFIERVKPYDPKGRYQTQDESDQIADILRSSFRIDRTIQGNRIGYEGLFEHLKSNRILIAK